MTNGLVQTIALVTVAAIIKGDVISAAAGSARKLAGVSRGIQSGFLWLSRKVRESLNDALFKWCLRCCIGNPVRERICRPAGFVSLVSPWGGHRLTPAPLSAWPGSTTPAALPSGTKGKWFPNSLSPPPPPTHTHTPNQAYCIAYSTTGGWCSILPACCVPQHPVFLWFATLFLNDTACCAVLMVLPRCLTSRLCCLTLSASIH